MSISIPKIRWIIFYLAAAEIISLVAYYFSNIGDFLFAAILVFFLLISLLDLKYGFYILLAELLISSKGYLLFFESAGGKISIRMAFFVIFLSVWLAKTILTAMKNKKLKLNFLSSSLAPYYIILFIFIAWGMVNGLLNGYSIDNLFFDFNGWLYFLLIFPAYDLITDKQELKTVWNIFFAALVWLALKTLILVYLFSHEFPFMEQIYKWVRDTGVGEITRMDNNFYRIFFQSHIFLIVGYFVYAFFLISALLKNGAERIYRKYLPFFTLVSAAIIVSLSRSYWLGLFAAGIVAAIAAITIFRAHASKLLKLFATLALGLILGISLIVLVVKFPFPRPLGEFSASDISERAIQISDEPGASSRWALLPVLNNEILEAPLLGKGFGATVTYQTSDPRIIRENPDGKYTTYAFEWGWHEIWLKLGILGLLAYLIVYVLLLLELFLGPSSSPTGSNGQPRTFFCSCIAYFKSSISSLARSFSLRRKLSADDSLFTTGLAIGLIAMAVVHIFSPYLNHPLGIGMLIIASLTADIIRKGSPQ